VPFRRTLAVALAVASAIGFGACDDNAHEPSTVEPDEVYVAVIRWQLARQQPASQGTAPDDSVDGSLPVLYIAAADGTAIDAKVQARVAAATTDDVKVRFADSRDEALDLDLETEPVRDDGLLLSITGVEAEASRQTSTEVIVYRSIDDQQTWLLTVTAASDGASITSSTLQPS
jgi:hypothetical protein